MPRFSGLTVFVLFLLFSSAPKLPAQSGTQIEQYSATALVTGIPTPPTTIQNTIPYDFYVYSYTPDDELQNLLNIYNTQGEPGFEKAFAKMKERGRISANFRTSQGAIKLVRSTTSGNETVIRLAMERILSHDELTSNSALSKYRFTIVELHLDSKGKGEGTMIYAAKLGLSSQGEWQIESFPAEPILLRNVHRLK
jgi:hypothetical protein